MASTQIRRGTADYRRVNLALVAAGFSTFAILYCVQALLPIFSRDFGLSPGAASLALSATSATLAVALLGAGQISDMRGRKAMMALCLFSVGALTVLSAFAGTWGQLLAIRALEGLLLSGVPAVAMAYLAEEIHPSDLGGAMGLYIAGNAYGGMTGRVLASLIVDYMDSWRIALGIIGSLGVAAALAFTLLLPPSRHFVAIPRPPLSSLHHPFLRHFKDPGLRWLFLTSFLLMGSFVTVYNYASYRLVEPPFSLGAGPAGAIFLVYLFGGWASASFGRWASRFERGRMLITGVLLMLFGLLLTLSSSLWLTVAGITCVTIGFFGGHAVASGWVGQRAEIARAQAASLYLFNYYMGSSIIGSLGGWFYAGAGWTGLAILIGCLLLVALFVATRLARIEQVKPISTTRV
nr:MFS transporter [Beijerinckia indica]